MKSRVDLHLHSTASDGQYTPQELVDMALARGMTAISLTDHDTVAGVLPAIEAARGTPLEVIPGVEISVDLPGREVHLLGYYIDPKHPLLREQLERLRQSRRRRAQGILTKLSGMGMPLAWERVEELAGGGSIGRVHIAQAMLERGYVSSTEEAFRWYIGSNGPAYVARTKLSPAETISLIRQVGGIPVLAHPREVMDLLPSLVKAGLVGLEVYYYGYSRDDIRHLLKWARLYHLIPTGGTDFHGPLLQGSLEIGAVWVPEQVVQQLQWARTVLATPLA